MIMMTHVFLLFFVILVLFLIVAARKATYVVNQAEVILIERFGKFHSILTSGIHFIIPFFDRPRQVLWTFIKDDQQGKHLYRYSSYIDRIDLRESVYDFPKQNVITRDNVTIQIDALLYYQVTDAKSAVYEVANLPMAIEKLTQTTLRNIIGSMDLDETLTSRDSINEKLRLILDEATDKWGVKVNRVELQEVKPAADILEAMEKQMRAERNRRALMLEAEGKKQAEILCAEGEKQAEILAAEGEKISKITRAEGEASARITIAHAEAEAIKLVQNALPGVDPLPYLVAINYIKTLPEITKGKNDKLIFMPYEASALVSSLGMVKELFAQK